MNVEIGIYIILLIGRLFVIKGIGMDWVGEIFFMVNYLSFDF